MTTIAHASLALALITAAPAQDWLRHVNALGDPTAGEAAERALLALGPGAVPALEQVVEAWDLSTQREKERILAMLRVVDLLGPDAADLNPALGRLVIDGNGRAVQAIGDSPVLPMLLQAVASVTPYGEELEFHLLFHHSMVQSTDTGKAAVFRNIYRFRKRADAKIESLEQARQHVIDNEIFTREVGAEVIFRDGKMREAVLLRDRLLDRENEPKGRKALKHNGFPFQVEDDFALRAARAIIRIAPDDPVSVIAFAVIAERHPHQQARLAAMRSLARFGPEVEVAIPEIIAVIQGADPALVAEALKVLGMAGKGVGRHLAAIDALAQDENATVARFANSLARRLRAMGCEVAKTDVEAVAAAATRRAIAAAIPSLASDDDGVAAAAEAVVEAEPDLALPLLLDAFRADQASASPRLLRCIGRVGATREHEERVELSQGIATTGTRWTGPSFSFSSGGDTLDRPRRDAYARLRIGSCERIGELAQHLEDDNTHMRLVAARIAIARHREVAGADADALRRALWQAVNSKHPENSKFDLGNGNSNEEVTEYGDEVQGAAAIALLGTTQANGHDATLLRCALRHPDAADVVRALQAWGAGAERSTLEQAAKDERDAVARAAMAALEQRGDK